MVDSTLTWNIHIDKISKTISRATGLLYKIRPFVNNKIFWGSADPTYLNRILILQKRIVRMMIYNDLREQDYSFPSSDPLFFKLEIFKIQDIFKIKISKLIYKCLDNTIQYVHHIMVAKN